MQQKKIIALPPAKTSGSLSLEYALTERRSLRSYEEGPLNLAEISQILWAGQGISHPRGYRTAPSAGAIYPMSLYIFLEDGIYRYEPKAHAMERLDEEDRRRELAAAALGQSSISSAPMVVVIVADVQKSAAKYQERAVRYCDMEAGHIGQNIALQAEVMGLGVVTIGAYDDKAVGKILDLPSKMRVCYVIPVGRR